VQQVSKGVGQEQQIQFVPVQLNPIVTAAQESHTFGFETETAINRITSSSSPWSTGTAGNTPWKRDEGSTLSSSTGPSSARSGSWFMYTEATGGDEGDTFDLNFDGSDCSWVSLTFYYHMYGSNMGTLRVIDGTGGQVWSESGNQGNSWKGPVTRTLTTAAFKFEGVRGNGFKSDMALDDITVTCFRSSAPVDDATRTVARARATPRPDVAVVDARSTSPC
jgi:hypothetical protein